MIAATIWWRYRAASPVGRRAHVRRRARAPPSFTDDPRLRLDHPDALHPHYAPEPHWYLAMLGVDPAWQRQGLGEGLMRPVFTAADRDGFGCYPEAPTEDDARYYERREFRVLGETDVPDSDVHVWLMLRDPAR